MFKFILLGIVQGLTEFLPVSSSGHLVLCQHFLGINKDVVLLDVFLHTGTILALITFFFKDILSVLKNIRLLGYIAAATIVTGIIGFTFKNTLESLFASVLWTGIFFLVNGIILLSTKLAKDRQKSLSLSDSALMGAAQGIAIIPSISRSGMTIASLLFCGVSREHAFKFSFIASIPAVLGAFLFEIKDTPWTKTFDGLSLAAGILAAYLFGLLALKFLSRIIQNNKLHLFGFYCLFVGIVTIFFIK